MLTDSVRNHRRTVLTSFMPVGNVYESTMSGNVIIRGSSEAMFNTNSESSGVRRSNESACSDGNRTAFVDSKKVTPSKKLCPNMFIDSESTLGHEPAVKNASCSFNDAFSAFITQKTTKRTRDIDETDYEDDVGPMNSKIARVEVKPQMKSMILKNHMENKIETSSRTVVSRDLMKSRENGIIPGDIRVNDTANINAAANINNTATTESFLNFIANSTKSIQKVVVDANGALAKKEKRIRDACLAEKERSFREACNALANLSTKNVGIHRVVANNQFVTRNESASHADRNGITERNVRVSRSSVNDYSGFNPGPNTRSNEFTNTSRIPASCNPVQSQINNNRSTSKQSPDFTVASGNNFVTKTNQQKLHNSEITRVSMNGLPYDINSAQNSRRSSLRRKSYDVCDTSLNGSCHNPIDCITNNYGKYNAGRGRTSSISYLGCKPVYVSLERLTLAKIERIKNQLTAKNSVPFESPKQTNYTSIEPPAVARCSELPIIINDCSSDSFNIPDYIVADLEADLLLGFEESKPILEKTSPGRKRLSTINSQTSSLPEHYLYDETSQDSMEFNQFLAAQSECKKSKKKKSELILPISSKKLNENRLAGEYVPNFMTHDDCGQELKRNATFLLSDWWLNDYGECTDITSMISNLGDWYKMDESWRRKKLMSKRNIFLDKFDDSTSRDSFLSTDLAETTKINEVKSFNYLNLEIDDNEDCLFYAGARASQCEDYVNKMEDLFHSSKCSTTFLQFCLPDKRQRRCYTKLVSRGRKIKTTNNIGENEVEESIQSSEIDHFLKSLSLYTVELSLHEILWPPELLANLAAREMDAIQSEKIANCEIELCNKSKETISLEVEIKPNVTKNDNIQNESKADKKAKRSRIKKVVVYDSIGSDGMIVSLHKPVKCSGRKPASARVKKSDLVMSVSSVIDSATSQAYITSNPHIDSDDLNIDDNIGNNVNIIVDENDASSFDVENKQESVLKVNNTCSSPPVVGINKVIYDETSNTLAKPKRCTVARVRVPKKNNIKSLVVPPSEVAESSLISLSVRSDIFVSDDHIPSVVPSNQTVLSDGVTVLTPCDKSVVVVECAIVSSDKNVSSDSVSVLAPRDSDVLENYVSVPLASIVCSKKRTTVKRVRKKNQSDVTTVTNESGMDIPIVVTSSDNCESVDSNAVQAPSDPGTKRKAPPRKRPPRKKKSESINNVTSESSEVIAQDSNSNPPQEESGVKPKTAPRKRPPRKKKSVDKHSTENNSLISVNNSFMPQENSNSLQQFCAEISLNSFNGNDQCEDTAVQNSYHSQQRYNESRSISTDFVSISSSTGGLMDNDLIQGSGDVTNNSCNSDQVCGNYMREYTDGETSDFIQGSCNAGSVRNDFVHSSYHSSQINNDVGVATSETVSMNYNFTPSLNDRESNVEQMDCNSYQTGNNSLDMYSDPSINGTHTVPPSSDCPDITAEVRNYDGGDETPSSVTTGGGGGYNDISSWLAASMGL